MPSSIIATTILGEPQVIFSASGDDEGLKENIKNVPTILPKLLQVTSHIYNYKKSDFKDINDKQMQDLTRTKYGFIAQELKNIFPELVYTSDTGLLSIDYVSMIPILTEAIKELDSKVDSLQQIINDKNIKLKSSLSIIPIDSMNNSKNSGLNLIGSEAALEQNVPNPFIS